MHKQNTMCLHAVLHVDACQLPPAPAYQAPAYLDRWQLQHLQHGHCLLHVSQQAACPLLNGCSGAGGQQPELSGRQACQQGGGHLGILAQPAGHTRALQQHRRKGAAEVSACAGLGAAGDRYCRLPSW